MPGQLAKLCAALHAALQVTQGLRQKSECLGSWLRCVLHCMLLYKPPEAVVEAYNLGSWLCCVLHCMLLYKPPEAVVEAYNLGSCLRFVLRCMLLYKPPEAVVEAYRPELLILFGLPYTCCNVFDTSCVLSLPGSLVGMQSLYSAVFTSQMFYSATYISAMMFKSKINGLPRHKVDPTTVSPFEGVCFAAEAHIPTQIRQLSVLRVAAVPKKELLKI
jgi:hypothetical protein